MLPGVIGIGLARTQPSQRSVGGDRRIGAPARSPQQGDRLELTRQLINIAGSNIGGVECAHRVALKGREILVPLETEPAPTPTYPAMIAQKASRALRQQRAAVESSPTGGGRSIADFGGLLPLSSEKGRGSCSASGGQRESSVAEEDGAPLQMAGPPIVDQDTLWNLLGDSKEIEVEMASMAG